MIDCPEHGPREEGVAKREPGIIKFRVGDMAIVRRSDDDISFFFKKKVGEPLWSSPTLRQEARGLGLAKPDSIVIVSGICVCPDGVWKVSINAICQNGIEGWLDQDGLQKVDVP